MTTVLAFFAASLIFGEPPDKAFCNKLLGTMEAVRVDKDLPEPMKIDIILELRKYYVSQSCAKPIF